MKNKTRKIILVICFLITLILNYLYGPFVYSTVMGLNKEYTIGHLCSTDRQACENVYFKDYLDKISSLSNKDRYFFCSRNKHK